MGEKPLFRTPHEAATVAFSMTRRLSFLVAWTLFGLLHLVALVLGLLALWAFQVTPEQVLTAVRSMTSSTLVSTAQAAGLSAIGLASGCLLVARWLWKKAFGKWLAGYLFRDVGW